MGGTSTRRGRLLVVAVLRPASSAWSSLAGSRAPHRTPRTGFEPAQAFARSADNTKMVITVGRDRAQFAGGDEGLAAECGSTWPGPNPSGTPEVGRSTTEPGPRVAQPRDPERAETNVRPGWPRLSGRNGGGGGLVAGHEDTQERRRAPA
ncbi:hypothetical protein ACRAWF_18495 [Streptomyces sp. L7]